LESTDRDLPPESNLAKDGGRNTKYTDHSDHCCSREDPASRRDQPPATDSFLNFNAADFDQDSLYKFSAHEHESTKFIKRLDRAQPAPKLAAGRTGQPTASRPTD